MKGALERYMPVLTLAGLVVSALLYSVSVFAAFSVLSASGVSLLLHVCLRGVSDVTDAQDIPTLVARLRRYPQSAHIQAAALESLCTRILLTHGEVGLQGTPLTREQIQTKADTLCTVAPLVYSALDAHLGDPEVVRAALSLLSSSVPTLEDGGRSVLPRPAAEVLLCGGGVRTLVRALRAHVDDKRIARSASMALGIVTSAVLACHVPIPADHMRAAVDSVLLSLARHVRSSDATTWGLYSLLHLAAADDEAQTQTPTPAAADAGGTPPQQQSEAEAEAPLPTMCAYIGAHGGVQACVRALQQHIRDERACAMAVLLLGVLVKSCGDTWRHVMATGAFGAVRLAMHRHPDSDKIQEVGSALLAVGQRLRAFAGRGPGSDPLSDPLLLGQVEQEQRAAGGMHRRRRSDTSGSSLDGDSFDDSTGGSLSGGEADEDGEGEGEGDGEGEGGVEGGEVEGEGEEAQGGDAREDSAPLLQA